MSNSPLAQAAVRFILSVETHASTEFQDARFNELVDCAVKFTEAPIPPIDRAGWEYAKAALEHDLAKVFGNMEEYHRTHRMKSFTFLTLKVLVDSKVDSKIESTKGNQ